MEGWSAYPPYDLKDDDPYYPVIDSLSAGWIFACAADAKKRYRVSGDKVFIIGHSQGAGFAIICAALHPEKVGSYFAYAPFVPDYYITGDMLKGLKKNKVKVYLAHGTRDKVLDIENSKRAEKAMKEAGIDCTFRIFDTEHMFAKEIVAFAREWLALEVRPPATDR
jgi:predicted esterase